MNSKTVEKDNLVCPKCGERVVKAGTTYGQDGKILRYQCTSKPPCNGKTYPFKTTKPKKVEVKEPKTE